jgi:subtilisin family serine protease
MLSKYVKYIYVCLIVLLVTNGVIAEVKVAILDSGSNTKYEEGISFIDDTPADLNGHGTTVAKIIKEINPDAKLYIAKVLDSNGRSTSIIPLVKGIEWAISRKVDLINISLQIPKDNEVLHDAIKEAYSHGIIIIAAAGNKGDIIDALMDELYRNSPKPGISTDVKYPAKYEEVIAIGAVSRLLHFDRHEKYSPIGPKIEFVSDGSYGSQNGTSFASASATGIISKIKSDFPDYNGIKLRDIIKYYARDIGDKGRDKKFGYGKLEYTHEMNAKVCSIAGYC